MIERIISQKQYYCTQYSRTRAPRSPTTRVERNHTVRYASITFLIHLSYRPAVHQANLLFRLQAHRAQTTSVISVRNSQPALAERQFRKQPPIPLHSTRRSSSSFLAMASHPPASLPSAVAAFQRAADDAQIPSLRVAAEATLSAFQTRADVIDVALAVVFQTSSAIARYHACGALRSAALQRWEALPAEARYGAEALRVRLVTFAVASPLHSMERNAVLYCAAGFTRRAYLEEGVEGRRRFLELVCGAAGLEEGGDGQKVIAALEMLALVVGEFGVEGKGVERDRLAQARKEFAGEDGELFMVFRAANAAFARLVGGGGGERSPEVVRAIAHRALTVIADVLGFQSGGGGEAGPVFSVNRGKQWGGLLAGLAELVPLLFRLFDGMRAESGDEGGGGGAGGGADLRSALHEAMCCVTAITRKSYPSAAAADAVLFAVLRCVQERDWVSVRCSSFEEDRLLYGELWRRAVAAHGLAAVYSAAPGILDSFATNTVQLFRAKAAGAAAGESDINLECDCMLLDTWVGLTLQAEALGNADALRAHAASIVDVFVNKSLSSLAPAAIAGAGLSAEDDEEEDFGFDDESHELAQLDAAAALCRFAPKATLGLLADLLANLSKRVFLCVRGGPLGPLAVLALHRAQDDFVWVVRLAGMALADDGVGEQPEVPASFLHGAPESVVRLLGAVFAAVELDTNTLAERTGSGVGSQLEGSEVSPRVEMVLLQALVRVAKTYLLPVDAAQVRAAAHCVGGEEMAGRARAICLSKAVFGVCDRAFEPEVADAGAELLLVLAPGRSSGRYVELGENARWEPLPSFGLDRFKPLQTCTTEKVGTCLAHFYGNSVVDRVVKPANVALHGLSSQKANMADASEQAVVALSILAGVAQCPQAATFAHEPLLAALRAPQGGACIATRDFARSNVSVPVAVVKFAQDVVACHMPLLPEAAATACFKDCVTLVSETVNAVLSHATEVACEDAVSIVYVILSLLHRLQELHSSPETSEAAFFGLSVVRPLVSDAVMTYPGVKAKYYSLVMLLVCGHPEYIVRLPSEFAGKVLLSVQEGCHESESRSSFEAVCAVASFRARHPELQEAHVPSLGVVECALEKFVTVILEGVMLGGGIFGNSFDAAADALLPLLLCGGRTGIVFQQAGQSLVQRSGSNEAATIAALASVSDAVQEAGPVLGYMGKGSGGVPAARQLARETFRCRVHDLASAARLVMSRC